MCLPFLAAFLLLYSYTFDSRFGFCEYLPTVACQDPLSMEFSRKESWSPFPCPPPGDLPNPGIKPVSLVSPALSEGLFTMRLSQATWEAIYIYVYIQFYIYIYNSYIYIHIHIYVCMLLLLSRFSHVRLCVTP